jgi:two-component system sensor histidine kinase AlgZ
MSEARPPAGPDAPAESALGLSSLASTGFLSTTGPVLRSPLCRLSVLLRALLLVLGSLAAGQAWLSRSLSEALAQWASLCGLALPGLLVWIVCACGLYSAWLQRRWVRGGSVAVATGLAGCLAWLGWALDQHWALGLTPPDKPWLVALWGGACAWALLHWLTLLGQAQTPADTAARLAELQARIRPHFLFNTLNAALSLVRVDPERAERVLEDLSELFRAALSEAHSAVPLEQEVELARRYLDIEQVRFGARLNVLWDLDPAAACAWVPPLFLQPLVENAVRHGVEPSDAGAWVRVRTRRKGNRVHLWVLNSLGERPSSPGHGLALDNVRKRLSLMHDLRVRLEADAQAGVFRVYVSLPVQKW